MATITTISNGAIKAQVTSDGAQLLSLEKDGVEYLWQRDAQWWGGTNPVLFPFVGTIRNNFATSPAGDIKLPRHGLARQASHEVAEELESKVAYLLSSNDETRANFPYDFELRMSYELTDESTIAETFTVVNTGTEALPFCVGGHPAFNVPLAPDAAAGQDFADYELAFAEPWTYDVPTLDIAAGLIDWATTSAFVAEQDIFEFNHRTFDVDTLILHDVPGRTIQLKSKSSGRGVQLDFPGFDYLGIWSAAGDAPFVAVEPWTGCATGYDEDDEFTHKRGITLLPAGETFSRTFTIKVLEG